MRISDWSSDVCSSDLPACPERDLKRKRHRREAVTEEDKVRRAAPHVGSARRRHRDVGGRKRRRVVEPVPRSEEHTSELQSLMRISYAVFCLKKKNKYKEHK